MHGCERIFDVHVRGKVAARTFDTARDHGDFVEPLRQVHDLRFDKCITHPVRKHVGEQEQIRAGRLRIVHFHCASSVAFTSKRKIGVGIHDFARSPYSRSARGCSAMAMRISSRPLAGFQWERLR